MCIYKHAVAITESIIQHKVQRLRYATASGKDGALNHVLTTCTPLKAPYPLKLTSYLTIQESSAIPFN